MPQVRSKSILQEIRKRHKFRSVDQFSAMASERHQHQSSGKLHPRGECPARSEQYYP